MASKPAAQTEIVSTETVAPATFTLTTGTFTTAPRKRSGAADKWAATFATIPTLNGKSADLGYTVPDGISEKATLRHMRAGAKAHGLKVRAQYNETDRLISFRLTKPQTKPTV